MRTEARRSTRPATAATAVASTAGQNSVSPAVSSDSSAARLPAANQAATPATIDGAKQLLAQASASRRNHQQRGDDHHDGPHRGRHPERPGVEAGEPLVPGGEPVEGQQSEEHRPHRLGRGPQATPGDERAQAADQDGDRQQHERTTEQAERSPRHGDEDAAGDEDEERTEAEQDGTRGDRSPRFRLLRRGWVLGCLLRRSARRRGRSGRRRRSPARSSRAPPTGRRPTSACQACWISCVARSSPQCVHRLACSIRSPQFRHTLASANPMATMVGHSGRHEGRDTLDVMRHREERERPEPRRAGTRDRRTWRGHERGPPDRRPHRRRGAA